MIHSELHLILDEAKRAREVAHADIEEKFASVVAGLYHQNPSHSLIVIGRGLGISGVHVRRLLIKHGYRLRAPGKYQRKRRR